MPRHNCKIGALAGLWVPTISSAKAREIPQAHRSGLWHGMERPQSEAMRLLVATP
jgi:hypothetical protein